MLSFTKSLAIFLLPTLAASQSYSGPYCGAGDWPNADDCKAALTVISADGDYSSRLEFAKGDCQVAFLGGGVGAEVSITGKQLFDAIDQMTIQCGDNVAWTKVNGGNVSVEKRS
jgi:hypothetical protein